MFEAAREQHVPAPATRSAAQALLQEIAEADDEDDLANPRAGTSGVVAPRRARRGEDPNPTRRELTYVSFFNSV